MSPVETLTVSERLAYAPLVALMIVCACVVFVAAGEALGAWLIRRFGTNPVETGRRLASERDDLIARGVDPADLLIPLAPFDVPGPGQEDYIDKAGESS